MKSLSSPQEVVKKLSDDQIFKDWEKQHPKNFLSHLFCSVSSDFKAKSNWEVGFFDEGSEKITVFTPLANSSFEIKPADDVFKKPTEKVEKLDLECVKTNLDDAVDKFREKLPEYFPKELLGDGFLVLQTINEDTVWNFSFITKSLKFVNIKISSKDVSVVSHDVIELMQKS